MICSGTDALTGQVIEVSFSRTISNVHEVPASAADPVYLAPGFIDIQVNGFMGVDFNDPVVPLADLTLSLRAILQTGVTRCLPTVITGGPDDMLGCLRNLRRVQLEIENGHAIAGFHVEGPYIGPEDGPRGAHPARWVRPPSINEYRRWQDVTAGQVRVVTISPKPPHRFPLSLPMESPSLSATPEPIPTRSRQPLTPGQLFPPTSVTVPTSKCAATPITFGTRWPKIV